jgi:hypothetical protein
VEKDQSSQEKMNGRSMANTIDRATIQPRLTASIIAVAVFQIVVSVLTLILFGRGMRNVYFSDQYINPADKVLLGVLLGTALLEITVAIGLLFLKNWARLTSLCVVTVSFCASAIALILHKRQPGFDFTPGLLELALWILTPVSAWWWILFTRKRVRAQFN